MLGYRPIPGSLIGKGNQRNYRFSPADEATLIAWINEHLSINWVELAAEDQSAIEAGLIRELRPILNLAGNPAGSPELSRLRAECVRIGLAEV
ncbi:hypothetical protein ACI1US_01141 [Leucobacter sp. BZR 635]